MLWILLMAWTFATGTTPTATGTQNVAHGQGSAPDFLLMIALKDTAIGFLDGEQSFSVGASDGTNEACTASNHQSGSSAVIISHNDVLRIANGTSTLVEANTSSVDATNWVLNFTTVDAVNAYQFVCLFGGGLTEAKVIAGSSPTATGNQNVAHGMGGAPDALIGVHHVVASAPPANSSNVWSLGFWGNGQGVSSNHVQSDPTDCSRFQDQSNFMQMLWTSQSDLELASVSSVDATNVVLNWSKAHGTNRYYWMLALRGVEVDVGSDTQRTSAGTKDTTTTIDPELVLLSSVCNTVSASINTEFRFSFGFGDGASNYGIWGGVLDAQTAGADNQDSYSSSSKAIASCTPQAGNPSIQAEAGISALGTGLFTLNWTTADAVAREFNFMALKVSAAAAEAGVGDALEFSLRIDQLRDFDLHIDRVRDFDARVEQVKAFDVEL